MTHLVLPDIDFNLIDYLDTKTQSSLAQCSTYWKELLHDKLIEWYENNRKIYVSVWHIPEAIREFYTENRRRFTIRRSLDELPPWFQFHKDLGDYHQVFHYMDEYNRERYYTVHAYNATPHFQACSHKPYESLGFHSDKNGKPLCENEDPWNNGDVNNCGRDIDDTFYATVFDVAYASHYWWNHTDDVDE